MSVTCPHCEQEIDVPEIVEIDPNAELKAIRAECPQCHEVGLCYIHQEMRDGLRMAGWRKVID